MALVDSVGGTWTLGSRDLKASYTSLRPDTLVAEDLMH